MNRLFKPEQFVVASCLLEALLTLQRWLESRDPLNLTYIPCGPSMMDCPVTSGNRPQGFPGGFRHVSSKETKSLVIPAVFELYTVKSTRWLELPVILSIYQKPAGNLLETSRAGFQRFLEVSGQSILDGPHGAYLFYRSI